MPRRNGFPSGRRDTRITVLRRMELSPALRAGNRLGDYAPAFSRYAAVIERQLSQMSEAGAARNVAALTLTLPDDSLTRTITVEDRVEMHDVTYAVTGVGIPDRIGQVIAVDLESRRGG